MDAALRNTTEKLWLAERYISELRAGDQKDPAKIERLLGLLREAVVDVEAIAVPPSSPHYSPDLGDDTSGYESPRYDPNEFSLHRRAAEEEEDSPMDRPYTPMGGDPAPSAEHKETEVIDLTNE
jgi:hypothetical protein